MRLGVSGKNMALLLALGCLLSGTVDPLTALAKKKAKDTAAATVVDPVAEAEAKLTKDLTPINDQLTKLLVKIQSRDLLSPADAGKLVDIKYKLLDFLTQSPQSAQLTKPLYQAGVLFVEREEYNDAYEMFNYLGQGFATTTYGMKAKGQMQQLEKRFGPNYFAVEAAVTTPAPTAAVPGATPTTGATTPAPAAATTPAAPAAAGAKKK